MSAQFSVGLALGQKMMLMLYFPLFSRIRFSVESPFVGAAFLLVAAGVLLLRVLRFCFC